MQATNFNGRSWERKAAQVFAGQAVSKSLAREAGLPRLPQYVVEHLVANYVNPQRVTQDLQRLRERVAQVVPEAETRELLKAHLMREGSVLIWDKLDVRTDLRTGRLVGALSNFGENSVEVPAPFAGYIPRLLRGGAWGAIRLEYVKGKRTNAIKVAAMTAFQEEDPSVDIYAQQRAHFTTDEWINLLLSSLGYEPSYYKERRTKLLLLSRLIPMVETNTTTIELGPRQTGKTFLLRNVSPSVYTASGANVTAASMFANASTGALGILATYKVVVLDEIADTHFDNLATVAMLKDYLESGNFSRGGRTYTGDASLVMAGNLDVVGTKPSPGYRHLFEVLPEIMQDTALLDRVHAYIPGWELPKISREAISNGVGLTVDYLGQILHLMRGRDFRAGARQVNISGSLTQRDRTAIEKSSSGLLKLLYPNNAYTEAEVNEVVDLAVELRLRVHDQLAVMAPGEFRERAFGTSPQTEQKKNVLEVTRAGILH